MKTTIKLIGFILLSAISFLAHAQKEKGSKQQADTIGIFIDMLGETTYMFEKVTLSSNGINYIDAKGKNIYQPHKYIKLMESYGRIFLSVSPRFSDDGIKLMEVLALGPKHSLLQLYNGMTYALYAYDQNFKMIMNNKIVANKGSAGWKSNNRNVFDEVKKYFNDCSELMTKLQKNIDAENGLTDEIYDIRCPDAPSYEAVIEILNKKPWYDELIQEQQKKANRKK